MGRGGGSEEGEGKRQWRCGLQISELREVLSGGCGFMLPPPQIIAGGAAASDGRLTVGTRILQVNSVSFLGRTLDEAMKLLHSVLDRMNLLVCHGYNPHSVPQTIDTVDEFGYVGSEPVYNQTAS